MYGFIGSYGSIKRLSTYHRFNESSSYIENEIREEKVTIKQMSLKKFENDKIFLNTKNLMLCIEGIVYNLSEKQEKTEESFEEIILKLYLKYGKDIISHLNGNFAMVIWDKDKDVLILYANHTSFKPLYYWIENQNIIFSTDICWLYDTMFLNQKSISLSEAGTYCLLSHGYMLDDLTLVKNVKKVVAGHYIIFEGGCCKDILYLDYTKEEINSGDYNSLLSEANQYFNHAIKLLYEKDKEYKYKHICTLSGGLDSRAVLFASYDMGYKKQLSITMAQNATLDQTIAEEIASDLCIENVFYSLDNGNYLLEIDKAIEANGGMITYQGFSHTMKLFDVLNLSKYGAIHTGEIGDCVFGGHRLEEYKSPSTIEVGALSKKLIAKIPKEFQEKVLEKYKTKYDFFLYGRGFNSAVNGWLASNYYTESTSPFVDVDFLKFMMTVPLEYRADSKFYIDWMKKYHPQMCKYKWEAFNTLPTSGKARRFIGKLERKIQRDYLKKPFHMNPYGKWYLENSNLRNYIQTEYERGIKRINKDDLKEDLKYLYSGTIQEKFQVLTFLKAIERFHIECNYS